MNLKRCILLLALAITLLNAAAICQEKPRSAREREAAANFKALLDLRTGLEKIPTGGEEREPHRSFLKRNESRIQYDDPSARYIVRSEQFWSLREKYRDLAIADDIAWAAAENPLGGECEGEMSCSIHAENITLGRYLRYYPKGKHAKAAVVQLKAAFESYADEALAGVGFTAPEGGAGRAELRKLLRDLAAAVGKVPGRDSAETLVLLRRVSERYR